ncbi:Rv3235 family protein [Micromonospora zhanjiangensis]
MTLTCAVIFNLNMSNEGKRRQTQDRLIGAPDARSPDQARSPSIHPTARRPAAGSAVRRRIVGGDLAAALDRPARLRPLGPSPRCGETPLAAHPTGAGTPAGGRIEPAGTPAGAGAGTAGAAGAGTAGAVASPGTRQAAHLVLGRCLEILNGYRPVGHLRALSIPAHAPGLVERIGAAVRRIGSPATPRPGRPTVPFRLRRVRVCEPRPGAAEIAAVLGRGDRAWAMTLRLERRRGNWLLTDADLLIGRDTS